MNDTDDKPEERRGFIASITRMVDEVVQLLITKLELFQVEVEEEWRRVVTILVMIISAAIAGHLAIIFLTLTLVAIFWDQRQIVLVVITLLYAGGAVALGLAVRRKLNTTRTKLFTTTLSELRKDREWLRKDPQP